MKKRNLPVKIWIFYWALSGVASPLTMAQQPASPPITADRAKQILSVYCGNCHLPGKTIDGKKGQTPYAQDVERFSRDDWKGIFENLDDRSMPRRGDPNPPKVSSEQKVQDLTALQAYAQFMLNESKPGSGVGLTLKTGACVPESVTMKTILDDLKATKPEDGPLDRYRYINLNQLRSSGMSDEDITKLKMGFNKLFNTLTWKPDITKLQEIDGGNVLKLDLKAFGWTGDKQWKKIDQEDPFRVLSKDDPSRKELELLTGSSSPVIRADWAMANLSRAKFADAFNDDNENPPVVTEGQLFDRLGANQAQLFAEDKVMSAGTLTSGVSGQNRVFNRFPTADGGFIYSSDDYANSSNSGKAILRDLLAPKRDGGEFIYRKPNGMWGWKLALANGNRLDDAPLAIIQDGSAFGAIVNSPQQCFSCHSNDLLKPKGGDMVHNHVLANPGNVLTDEQRNKLLKRFPGDGPLNAQLQLDSKAYQDLMEKRLGIPPGVDPITPFVDKFRQDGTRSPQEQACALGASLAELQALPGIDQKLSGIVTTTCNQRNDVFESALSDAGKALARLRGISPELQATADLPDASEAQARAFRSATNSLDTLARSPKSSEADISVQAQTAIRTAPDGKSVAGVIGITAQNPAFAKSGLEKLIVTNSALLGQGGPETSGNYLEVLGTLLQKNRSANPSTISALYRSGADAQGADGYKRLFTSPLAAPDGEDLRKLKNVQPARQDAIVQTLPKYLGNQGNLAGLVEIAALDKQSGSDPTSRDFRRDVLRGVLEHGLTRADLLGALKFVDSTVTQDAQFTQALGKQAPRILTVCGSAADAVAFEKVCSSKDCVLAFARAGVAFAKSEAELRSFTVDFETKNKSVKDELEKIFNDGLKVLAPAGR